MDFFKKKKLNSTGSLCFQTCRSFKDRNKIGLYTHSLIYVPQQQFYDILQNVACNLVLMASISLLPIPA